MRVFKLAAERGKPELKEPTCMLYYMQITPDHAILVHVCVCVGNNVTVHQAAAVSTSAAGYEESADGGFRRYETNSLHYRRLR